MTIRVICALASRDARPMATATMRAAVKCPEGAGIRSEGVDAFMTLLRSAISLDRTLPIDIHSTGSGCRQARALYRDALVIGQRFPRAVLEGSPIIQVTSRPRASGLRAQDQARRPRPME